MEPGHRVYTLTDSDDCVGVTISTGTIREVLTRTYADDDGRIQASTEYRVAIDGAGGCLSTWRESDLVLALGEAGDRYAVGSALWDRLAAQTIVAWLRSDGPGSPADMWGSAIGGNEWTTAADAIERGDHQEDK